jgi:hypothetical protein
MNLNDIVFKHPVAFIYTSYALYSVFTATLHLQLRIRLYYFTTCFGHKGPSSGVLFANVHPQVNNIIHGRKELHTEKQL